MKKFLVTSLITISFFANAQWTSLSGPNGAYLRDMERASDGSLYILTNNNTYAKFTNGGNSWQAINTSPSGIILFDLLISGSKFYGLYFNTFYTSNDGVTWTKPANTFPFSTAYKILKFGPDGFLIVYGFDGVFLSKDEGVTWTKILSENVVPNSFQYNNMVATTNGDLYAYSNTLGIRKFPYPGVIGSLSESNWQTVLSIPSVSYVSFLASGTTVYASTGNDLRISTNAGSTWSSVKRNITDTQFFGFWGLSPTGVVYYVNNAFSKIYSSTNPSTTDWTNIAQPFLNYGASPVTVTFETAATYYLGSTGFGVLKTTDTGATWSLKNTGLNEASMYNSKVGSTGRIIQFSNNSSKGYWESTDNGSTWTFTTLSDYISKSIKLSDGTILLYYAYGKVFKSTDATAASFTTDNVFYNMSDIYEDASGNLFGLAFTTSSCPACVTSLKLFKSINKGTSWTDITGTITGLPAPVPSLTPYHIAVDASNNIYASAYVNGVYKFYKIVGTACTELTTVPFTNYINNLFVQGTKIYAAQTANYYVSSDQGASWTTVGFSGDYVFPIKQNTYTGICVSKPGTFYISQDDGQSWNSSSLPSSSAIITDLDVASTGAFFASAINSTALKNPSALLVDPTTLPPYINFNWQPLNGPYGGSVGRMRPTTGGIVYAIANGFVLWKYNGTTWSRLKPTSAATPNLKATTFIYDVDVDASGNVYIVTNASSKVHKSIDGGATWSALNSTNVVGLPRRVEVFSDGSIVTISGNKVYKSIDGGSTFTVKFTGTASGYTRLPAVSSTEVMAIIGNNTEGFVVSTDKGETWIAKTLTSIVDATNGFIGNYMFDNVGNIILTYIQDSAVPSFVAKLAKSSNNATSWTATTDPAPSLTGFGRRTIALPTGEYIMTIQNYYDYYRSTDKGVTWTLGGNVGDVFNYAEASGGTTYIQSGSLSSGAGGIRGMQKTTDGGVTFSPANAGMPINTASEIKVFNNKDLLVGATSPYYSSDFGQNYQLATSQVAGNFLVLNDTIIGYGSRVLQRSVDGGKTWSPLGGDRFFSFLTKAATGKGFYAFSNSSLAGTTIQFGLFSSTDLVNWTLIPLSGLPTDYGIGGMVIDATNTIYAIVFDNVTGLSDVYKIAFGSAIKINQAIGLSSPATITYFNNKIYLYDQIGAIFKSTNGDVWTQSTAPPGNSLTITNGYLFVPSSNNTLWLSRDDGGTWQNVGDTPATGVSFRDVAINPYDGYAYATSSGTVTKRSGNMVMPDDKTKPIIKATDPIDLALNADLKPVLKFTFDEFTKAVAGKKIRIFDVNNQLSPVEIIDISAATIKDKTWSASMTVSLTPFRQYFVTIDVGVVTDIFGNAFLGITANSIWRFTVGDKQAPVITFTPDPLIKGANNKIFSVGITDDGAVSQAKIFYRSITKSTPEVSANLTLNGSSGKYEVTVPEIDFGKMGLEYYFTAQDAAGNSKRSPQTGYHYSYISFSSSSPIIPAGLIGVGGGISNWRMITVPYTLADNKVGTIFSELGSSDVSKWRMVTYKDQTSWSEFPAGFSTVSQGKGYFINTKELPQSGLNIDGATTPSNNKTAPFAFTLAPGWNQIGNPYNFPMKWSEVLAANGTTGASIGAKLKTFTGAYVDDTDDQLDVFEGAFVLNSGTSAAQITVPVVGSLAGGRKDQSVTESYDLANEKWIAPISLKMGGIENTFGGVGMHPQALTSVDQYDDFNPPHFLEYAEMSFSHPEHFLKNSTRDVVPTQSEYEWSFAIESNVKGEGEFTWDNTRFGFNTKELFMYDLQKGTLIDMRKQASYRFDPTKSTSFKVYYGEDLEKKIKPELITLGDAFPNPTKGEVTIPFTLPEIGSNYQVIVEVYDLLGRKTSLLDKSLEPGFHSVQWEFGDGQNNGLYTYRIKVIGANRSEILNKKIILNK